MLENTVKFLNDIIWSDYLVYFLLLSGVVYSLLFRFFQVRLFKDMVRLALKGDDSQQGVSSFQALAMSISLRVGVGNIAGVATAIGFGGPGAVFWMWLLAFLGAATSFIECTMSQAYKREVDGLYRSGPATYMRYGLKSFFGTQFAKYYGMLFAVCCVLDYSITAPTVQSNAISSSLLETFNIAPWKSGLGLVVVLALIIFGGVRRIARISQVVVPFMAGAYLIIATIIIVMNITELPSIIYLIISSAIGQNALYGGILGSAIAWGVRRGIYSNEAGMGSAPHIAGAAEVSHPAKQGLVQSFSVYIDTLLVCSATAFLILFSNCYNVQNEATKAFITLNLPGVEAGPVFTIRAIEGVFSSMGGAFVSIAILFFAFTTIMAFSYICETNVVNLFPERYRQSALLVFRSIFLVSTFSGTLYTQKLGWALGDLGIGIMVWINLVALVLLAKPAMVILKDYETQRRAGKDPLFDPHALELKNMDLWMDIKDKESAKRSA